MTEGTQGWTKDISICRRTLYHWAIPLINKEKILLFGFPYSIVGNEDPIQIKNIIDYLFNLMCILILLSCYIVIQISLHNLRWLENRMGALDVLDSIVSDGTRFPGVLDSVWTLDDARNVGTCDVAQSSNCQIQFRTGANIQLSGRLGAAVQIDGNWNDIGQSSVHRLNVTQIIEISILFLVEQINPTVKSDDDVVC